MMLHLDISQSRLDRRDILENGLEEAFSQYTCQFYC